jgi:uncharacterized protein YqeY
MTTINEQIVNEAQNPKSETRDLARYFLSLFQRESKNRDKTVDDSQAISIMKSFKKDIEEQKKYYSTEEYERMMNFLDKYLPSEANEYDIRLYLNTVNFNELSNKNQAIGMVKKYFNGNVDGKLVAQIVQNEY